MQHKKKKSAKQTARLITDTLWEYLKKLPAKERNKRLDKAHRSMRAKIAKARGSSGRANGSPKGGERVDAAPLPYAARSGR
jgi:hypothetical protein